MRRTDDYSERTGGSGPRKRKAEAVDRISGLPDSVLLHILSFLPTKCAVRTSLILAPFRGLWRSLPTLSFKDCDSHCYRHRAGGSGDGDRFSNFVDHVLALHEGCGIDRIRIELDFHANRSANPVYNSGVANRLDKWIGFALQKKVKALDVALMGRGCPLQQRPTLHYRMPSSLLNNSLIELCLQVCNLESLGRIQLKSLRKLSMFDVNLSDEVMRNLVLGGPSLEKLSLWDCHGLQVVKIGNHPSLKELKISNCRGLKEIDLARSGIRLLAVHFIYPLRKITCPNVVKLELDGSFKGVDITCGCSINDMALYIKRRFNGLFQDYPEVKTLLEKVRNAAYLPCAIGVYWDPLPPMILSDLQVFSIWKLTNQPRLSFNWKSVTTTLNFAKWHIPGISYLLESCDFLETLTVYVCEEKPTDIQVTKWKRARNFDGVRYWNLIEGTPHCLKHHLKNVMIYGCVTESYVMEFIEFLLGNALVLEKMVFSTKRMAGVTLNGLLHHSDIAPNKDFDSDSLVGFARRVRSLPRISPRAVVHFD